MRGRIDWQDQSWPGAVPRLEVDADTLGLIVVDVQYSCAHPKRRLAWLRPGPDEPPYRSPVGSPDHAILPEIAPQPGELVIDKNTSGAFNGSAIDFYLQGLGLHTLVICGVSTSACVDNTARDAADRGYNVIVVEDACAGSAGSEAAHEATLRTFGRYFGAVKTTAQLVEELSGVVESPALAAIRAR